MQIRFYLILCKIKDIFLFPNNKNIIFNLYYIYVINMLQLSI